MHSDPAGRGLMPQATTYLVLPPTEGTTNPAAMALACALLRAQPDLQRRGSSLMRGIDARTSVPAGWGVVAAGRRVELHDGALSHAVVRWHQTGNRAGNR